MWPHKVIYSDKFYTFQIYAYSCLSRECVSEAPNVTVSKAVSILSNCSRQQNHVHTLITDHLESYLETEAKARFEEEIQNTTKKIV